MKWIAFISIINFKYNTKIDIEAASLFWIPPNREYGGEYAQIFDRAAYAAA